MPRKKQYHDARQSLFDAMLKSEEARDTIRTMLRVKDTPHVWRGLLATPPGSLLATVVAAFRASTDIPLEIPFFATLHFLSAHLLGKGVTVDFAGSRIKPDLWSVILADSGAGKTFAINTLERFVEQPANFPEPASAAKFVDLLQSHNNSLWIRDEFAQFLRAIEQQTHMAELKDYLLRVYDGKRIERATKKDSQVIDDPALCILGLTVLQSFQEQVNAESMVDGFAQRFSYIVAERDPTRQAKDFAIYDLRPFRERIRAEWDKAISYIQHQEYHVGTEGEEAFKESFAMLLPPNEDIPLSFFRRIMFRGIRYALLYHILLGKLGAELDSQDLGWAGRVCGLHIRDAAWLVTEHGLPDLERLCRRADDVKQRLEAEGKPVTPRDIVRGVYGLRSTAEARAILSML